MTVSMNGESDAIEDVIPVRVLLAPETVAAYGEAKPQAKEALEVPTDVVPGFGGLHVDLPIFTTPHRGGIRVLAGAAPCVLTIPRSSEGAADGRAGSRGGGRRRAIWPREATPLPRPQVFRDSLGLLLSVTAAAQG